MTPDKVKDHFDKVFNGQPNPLTPDVIRYGSRHKYLYELTTGTGITGQPIFGVTVIHKDKTEHDHELSEVFQSRQDAETYIHNLGKYSRAELKLEIQKTLLNHA